MVLYSITIFGIRPSLTFNSSVKLFVFVSWKVYAHTKPSEMNFSFRTKQVSALEQCLFSASLVCA